jgi:hypothetical protein
MEDWAQAFEPVIVGGVDQRRAAGGVRAMSSLAHRPRRDNVSGVVCCSPLPPLFF